LTETQNPSFTMIVSTFQRRDMVCETVQTIGRIRYDGPFELVVIVDGSDDGTAEALEKLTLPFPYRVMWQPNGGLGHARNSGAALVRLGGQRPALALECHFDGCECLCVPP